MQARSLHRNWDEPECNLMQALLFSAEYKRTARWIVVAYSSSRSSLVSVIKCNLASSLLWGTFVTMELFASCLQLPCETDKYWIHAKLECLVVMKSSMESAKVQLLVPPLSLKAHVVTAATTTYEGVR